MMTQSTRTPGSSPDDGGIDAPGSDGQPGEKLQNIRIVNRTRTLLKTKLPSRLINGSLIAIAIGS
jgi:hypothetical protein